MKDNRNKNMAEKQGRMAMKHQLPVDALRIEKGSS